MTDAAGETQTYAYDRLGRMTARTDGLSATLSWTYDEHGRLHRMRRVAMLIVSTMTCSSIVVGCGRDAIDAADHIRALDRPIIETVRADATFMDGAYIHVLLLPSANDADARGVWCDVVIPTGIDSEVEVIVGLDDEQLTYWPPPTDCDDATDIPERGSQASEWLAGDGE